MAKHSDDVFMTPLRLFGGQVRTDLEDRGAGRLGWSEARLGQGHFSSGLARKSLGPINKRAEVELSGRKLEALSGSGQIYFTILEYECV